MLEEEELDDEFFMMRVRSDGALLVADQPSARSARIGVDFARDTADVTDRREHPVPLDPDRGRPRDLAAARGRRAVHASRRAATRRARSSAPPSPASPPTRSSTAPARCDEIQRRYIGNPEYSNLPRKFKTALTGHPSHDVSPETNDVVVRRHRPPRARPRLRPLGRRRPVHQPDARAEARRLDPARRGRRRLGGRGLDLPRLRLPPAALAGPAEVPGRRLGRREVPRGARERVPPAAPLVSCDSPAVAGRPPRPHRRARAARRPVLRRHRPDRRAGSPAPCWSSSPT